MSSALRVVASGKPVSLRDDPGYVRVDDRDREIQARVAELDRQRDRLLAGLDEAGTGRDLDRRAAVLLESGKLEESLDAQRSRLRVELGEVEDQRRVMKRAADLHRARVQTERQRAGAVIRDRHRAEHRTIVQNIAKAIAALSEALAAEERFREALLAGDIPLGDLRPMPLNTMRLDLDYDTVAALWMKDAKSSGLL